MVRRLKGILFLISLLFLLVSSGYAHDGDDPLALVPNAAVTNEAIRSGMWSDSATWSNGKVPTSSAVVKIATGVTVTYDIPPTDSRSSARIAAIRIDEGGKLFFPADRSSKLTVDTIIGLAGSTFQIGDLDNPVAADNTVEVVFDDGGVGILDRKTKGDPEQYGIGATFMSNTVQVFGAAKSAFIKASAGAAAGSKSIVLDSVPSGWRAGDKIIVTATYNASNARTQEVNQIQSIDGRTVRLTMALAEDHSPGVDQVPVYVANLTRNVVFRSAGGTQTDVVHRAHMMAMHDGNYDIRSAAFVGMGRTRKDMYLDGDGIADTSEYLFKFKTDEKGNRLPGPATNIKGRYPFHFHYIQNDPENTDPGLVQDCVVENSPGWGIVVHESYAHIRDNVSYDVLGSHYVAEDGNELGEVSGNIAILTRGAPTLGWHKQRVYLHDFGHINGFWFQGRAQKVLNNVAVGIEGEAFIWFHRSSVISPEVEIRAVEGLPMEVGHGANTLSFVNLPLLNIKNNTVVGAKVGFEVIKAGPEQGHDWRTHIEDTKVYNVSGAAAHFEYTSRYTIKGFLGIRQSWVGPSSWIAGIEVGNNTYQFALRDITLKGFDHTFYTPPITIWNETEDLYVSNVKNFSSNGESKPITIAKNYPYELWSIPQPFIKVLDSVDMKPNRFEIEDSAGWSIPLQTSFQNQNGTIDTHWWNHNVTRTLTKRDSIPDLWPQVVNFNQGTYRRFLLSKGFYTDPDGTRWIPHVAVFTDRYDNSINVKKLWKITLPSDWIENRGELRSNLGQPKSPVLIKSPSSVEINRHETAVFECQATHEMLPVSYRWFVNGKAISWPSVPKLRLQRPDPSLNGASITCEAFNYFGTARSAVANLMIKGLPAAPTNVRLAKN